MPTPIIVDLSPLEARAHELTKKLQDWEIESALELDAYVQSNLSPDETAKRIAPLIEAARSARRKIADATRYEIRVVGGEA